MEANLRAQGKRRNITEFERFRREDRDKKRNGRRRAGEKVK